MSEDRRSSQAWTWFGALFLVLDLLGHVFGLAVYIRRFHIG